MKIISVIKVLYNLKKIFLLLVFSIIGSLLSPIIMAENIQYLQQRASFAYDQMMQAQKKAEIATKKLVRAEKKVEAIKQQLAKAEQEAEIIRQESIATNAEMEQATSTWKTTSDALVQEWGQTGKR